MSKEVINIEPRHLEILKPILRQAKVDFFVFGSRVKNTNQKFSDLDICYKGALDTGLRAKIRSELQNSNLPYSVDLVDYNDCDEHFRSIIDRDSIKLDLGK